MEMRRRDFLISSVGAAAFLQASALFSRAEEKPLIGIQLYCVRGEFDKDVPGTLKKIAELGYDGVEFYGYGGTENIFKNYSAEQLRKLLDENKLKCCGIHMSLDAISEKNFDRTIRNNEILGNTHLIIASADNMMESPASIAKFATMLNEAAKKAGQHNMQVGYHCHGFDFKDMDGTTGWDRLFGQTNPEVIMQLDTGNCGEVGGDPIAILKKFPGLATTVHIKEYPGAPLSPDNAKWKEIIKLCKETQKSQWYIIEQGEAAGSGFGIAAESIATLKKML